MSSYEAVLLLGSNLGDKKKNIEDAVKLLKENGLVFLKKTEIVETKPIEFASSNYFCNFAAVVETDFSPIQLLMLAKQIEVLMGRARDSYELGKFMDRVIDIDIVNYGNLRFFSDRLTIPHERHFQREFSLALLDKLKTKKHKL